MDKKILDAICMAIESNRYMIDKTDIVILPTELVIAIYNLLSDKEKQILWFKVSIIVNKKG